MSWIKRIGSIERSLNCHHYCGWTRLRGSVMLFYVKAAVFRSALARIVAVATISVTNDFTCRNVLALPWQQRAARVVTVALMIQWYLPCNLLPAHTHTHARAAPPGCFRKTLCCVFTVLPLWILFVANRLSYININLTENWSICFYNCFRGLLTIGVHSGEPLSFHCDRPSVTLSNLCHS